MITRTTELKRLEQLYLEPGNNLVFMYGNRGSDKELLLRLLSRDKASFYYRARKCSDEKQLLFLKSEVTKRFDVTLAKDTFDECFTRMKSEGGQKLVVIIDEAQNAMKKEGAILESIMKLKSKKLYPGPVMIVIASSSIVFSERLIEEIKGEHPKAIDDIIKLEDMNFLDVVRAFPEYSVADCVSTYGIIGGVASYLNRWNGKKTIKENVCNNILRPTGFLHEEADNLIGSELRELGVYNTILSSIAAGNEKLNDLFEDTGYSRAKISVYMKNLAAFDIIKKVVSFETGGWDNAKKGVYAIASPYVNFWFTFVYPHMSDIYTMTAEEFYDVHIEPGLNEYLSKYFSDVCREYLELLNKVDKLPIKLEKTGTWVGKNGVIDVIAQNSVRENLVGICNWSEEKMPYEAYENLLSNMKKAMISAKNIYLFSATAFDSKLVDLANSDSKVTLIDMTEL